MLCIVYTILLILLIIPYIFIFKRLNVSLNVTTLTRLFKLLVFGNSYDNEIKNEIRDEERVNYVDDGATELPKGLCKELMPRHVAVIMDGNRRWAKKAGLMTSEGHEAGAKRLLKFAQLSFNLGIRIISAFAFSTENWRRDKVEVDCIMSLIEHYLNSKIHFFQREEIRVSIIGDLVKVPESLLRTINKIEEATKIYKRKHLIMAIDYSGRFDIMNACKNIVKKTEQGLIHEGDVDEKLMEKELMTKSMEHPNPDLLIRTSGEQRISNFFLWQMAYTELFFSPLPWPDFDEHKFLEALVSYQKRERRFGTRLL